MLLLKELCSSVLDFERAAHKILAVHETSTSRVVLLEYTYQELGKMSLQQDDLIRQALRCIESKLFKAAHVMAWAGFMDFLQDKLSSDGFRRLRSAKPTWRFTSIDELREQVPEYQLIEVARELSLCTKNEMKALHGLLNKRNECAHPSNFYPGLNETLGYVSEVLQRIACLQSKSL